MGGCACVRVCVYVCVSCVCLCPCMQSLTAFILAGGSFLFSEESKLTPVAKLGLGVVLVCSNRALLTRDKPSLRRGARCTGSCGERGVEWGEHMGRL